MLANDLNAAMREILECYDSTIYDLLNQSCEVFSNVRICLGDLSTGGLEPSQREAIERLQNEMLGFLEAVNRISSESVKVRSDCVARVLSVVRQEWNENDAESP